MVTKGTARIVLIPNIAICAKTGTAEKFTILDGKKIKLDDNAMFVCFAPKDDPKIAIAVAVENAGYGGTWGGPIARVLMEKYLNDTISKASMADYERISNTNKMPKHLKRLQFKTDSIRARQWFELRKDSSYIRKYISTTVSPVNDNSLPLQPAAPVRPYSSQTWLAVLPDNRNTYSTQPVARNRA